jgi:hypothetical protein
MQATQPKQPLLPSPATTAALRITPALSTTPALASTPALAAVPALAMTPALATVPALAITPALAIVPALAIAPALATVPALAILSPRPPLSSRAVGAALRLGSPFATGGCSTFSTICAEIPRPRVPSAATSTFKPCS